jgi:hypothetical protein
LAKLIRLPNWVCSAAEGVVVECHDRVGFCWRQREYDGELIAERQQRQRAVRREAFPGASAVSRCWRDFADHRVLGVIADLDFRVVGRRAFGMYQQLAADAAQCAGVAQGDGDAAGIRRGVEDFGFGEQRAVSQPGGQRGGEVAVADDVAERRQR